MFLSYGLHRRALGFTARALFCFGGANMVFKIIMIGVSVLVVAGVGYFLMWAHDDEKYGEDDKHGKK
jgi:hypothetical protein